MTRLDFQILITFYAKFLNTNYSLCDLEICTANAYEDFSVTQIKKFQGLEKKIAKHDSGVPNEKAWRLWFWKNIVMRPKLLVCGYLGFPDFEMETNLICDT